MSNVNHHTRRHPWPTETFHPSRGGGDLAYIVNDLAVHVLESHFELLSRGLAYSRRMGGYIEITQRLLDNRINCLRIPFEVLPSSNVKIVLSPYWIFGRGSCNDSQESVAIGNGICYR